MSDLLHELENNEAILLMYIAGELPEEERREVEQMLEVDTRLREMHEELRSAWTTAMTSVDRLDHVDDLPLSREVAARQVGRMVRQWHAARLAAPRIAPPVVVPWRPRWWLATPAVAAMLVVGFLAWWGMTPEVIPQSDPARQQLIATLDSSTTPDRQDDPTLADSTMADFFSRSYASVDAVDPTGLSSPGLTDLESQARHLEDLTAGGSSNNSPPGF